MNMISLRRLAINEDVDAEFNYWKSQLLLSAWTATGFAFATCAAIAYWPPGSGNPELRSFAIQIWPLLAEFAFWLGFLLGMLWGAAKRIGAALAGSLPWQPAHRLGRRAELARTCGQGAVCLAMGGIFLWMGGRFALLADAGTVVIASSEPAMLAYACFGAAVVFGAMAVIGRNRSDR